MSIAALDVNADLGEGMPHDAAVMPYVTSASIACGGHAGDAETMARTVALCQRYGVAAGAHPGFADRVHFGRRAQVLEAAAVVDLVATQVHALAVIAGRAGVALAHVKPHGALYNAAAVDDTLAAAVATGIAQALPGTVLLGLPDSALERAAHAAGLRFAGEVFIDRAYDDAGRLLPRGQPGAIIEGSDDELATRLLGMLATGSVPTVTGGSVPLRAVSACIHGDDPRAPALARAVRTRLEGAGIALRPAAALAT